MRRISTTLLATHIFGRSLDDLPKLIKVLGEELVLFRDKSGDTGLLHKHCAHRGASLEYGIIADHGAGVLLSRLEFCG